MWRHVPNGWLSASFDDPTPIDRARVEMTAIFASAALVGVAGDRPLLALWITGAGLTLWGHDVGLRDGARVLTIGLVLVFVGACVG